jgi:acetoacetyl-CoA synthetase
MIASDPLWQPDADRVANTRLTAFTHRVERDRHAPFGDYADLHRWSVTHSEAFWSAFWDFAGVIGTPGPRVLQDAHRMPGARFFPDGRLNFTENLLRRRDDTMAIVAETEHGRREEMTWRQLADRVTRTARALERAGVGAGDRVAGIVANVPEAVIAALGAAAIGAVWSSCSPDFGVDGIVDRFGQIGPKVLIAVDGYVYGGRTFDCRPKIEEVVRQIAGVRQVVVVPLMGLLHPVWRGVATVPWDEWLEADPGGAIAFERFEFNHPVFILFSSGTTGIPKCIVHGAGGTLVEHMKEHQLQSDIRPGDRVFYFTTCGWMMWNWLITVLASGSAMVLYDGSPFAPTGLRLFELAERAGATLFGVSARFLDAVRTSGLEPRTRYPLPVVRTIASTGSPLSPETFEFVYRAIKADVHLASISGGTDIVGCFVGGNPNGPVWSGEIQAPGLGMAIDVFDDAGRPIREQPGELVCTAPFPCMPIGFWDDPSGERYRATYFERFPGVWHHGDWIETTAHGGYVILGRSDATIKPGGVRIGTAEIYRQVAHFPEVIESVAVGQRWQGDERIILFVRLGEGAALSSDLRARIADRIRTHCSPRHVPARIVAVADIPRTRSGKTVEIAVRRVIHGEPVQNREALDNPAALDLFRDLPELQS